jgi:ATP-dependent DNA helicase RecG
MHLVEQVGSGIGRIRQLIKDAGLPEPIFLKNGIFTLIIKRLQVFPKRTTQKTTRKTTRKTDERILEILTLHPNASRSEIANTLGDITEDGVKYHLNKLKASKTILRIGPDKGGYWKILKENDK